MIKHLLITATLCAATSALMAQNPLIMGQFTADPSARVFGDRVYVYPSHDIKATPGRGKVGWFCMEDYHVFSSTDLTDWKDHGKILSQTGVPWADPAAYSMWAPDCVYRNGKYYFYFPATKKSDSKEKPFAVGVAISTTPYGPFIPQAKPIEGVKGIDPNVFIDKNGQAYLYWAQGEIFAARLKSNMTELASAPVTLGKLPDKGLKEGPYLFERNNIYYLTYPHVENKTERLEYAIADNPLGPFKFAGVIMDESASGCWTNHQSIMQFKGQWYLFYHDKDLSPKFDKNRSIRADSLFFNNDGTIKKVIPTFRGVGITTAYNEIQIDRYSDKSPTGTTVAALDTANVMLGWKTSFTENGAWIRYNSVNFISRVPKAAVLKVFAPNGGRIEIHAGKLDGPVIADADLNGSEGWKTVEAAIKSTQKGVRNLFIVSKTNLPIEIDWIKFK